MHRRLKRAGFGIVCAAIFLVTIAGGQETASQRREVAAQPLAADATVAPSASPVEPTNGVPDTALDPKTLFPDLPALRPQKISLVGGTIERLDRVRDQLTLRIFGAGKLKISFDPRTQIYQDGHEASVSDLRQGDRVSIDTELDGSAVFARKIRLTTTMGAIQGTVVGYRQGELVLRDILSPRFLKLRITPETGILDRGRSVSSGLARGTLVAVTFGSQKDGHVVAQEVSVLARPGESFTFAGRVTALDLRAGLLVLISATDGKTYEIYLDPSLAAGNDNLRESAKVIVLTRFDGNRYVAQNVTVN